MLSLLIRKRTLIQAIKGSSHVRYNLLGNFIFNGLAHRQAEDHSVEPLLARIT